MQKISFFRELEDMLSARYPLLYLESPEFDRAYHNLRPLAQSNGYDLHTWNIVDGWGQWQPDQNSMKIVYGEMLDMEAALIEISDRSKNDRDEIYVLEDIHSYMDQPTIKVCLRKLAEDLRFAEKKKHVILLSPVRSLPTELEKMVTVLELPLPGREELASVLQKVARDANVSLESRTTERLVDAALGMTEFEADQAYCLAWAKQKLGEGSEEIVMKEKKQIIKKSGLLEFYDRTESMAEIGGLKNLKKWLEKRGVAFSAGARSFHLDLPKGLLMLGIPGCGKSLTAKAISAHWNMQLLRLDIGKIFEGLVGSSEGNIRKAIQTAEAVAPCVLWIDEIEKGLAGMGSGGNGDSGVSSRVFSTLLTWMQEKEKPVFVVATANGISNLPPELLRKGRFDGIFFVDLPDKAERRSIFEIHLRKKGQNPADFPLDSLAEKSDDFSGAEIAEAVNEALFSAFSQSPIQPSLKTAHLMQAIADTVPLSMTMRQPIEELRKWAETRATPAGTPENAAPDPKSHEISKDRIRNLN